MVGHVHLNKCGVEEWEAGSVRDEMYLEVESWSCTCGLVAHLLLLSSWNESGSMSFLVCECHSPVLLDSSCIR